MLKHSIKKLICATAVSTSLLSLSPIAANAAWKQNNIGWWYTEGNSYATGWRLIGGKWYYFYSNGYMASNTTIEGYRLGSSGAMIDDGVYYGSGAGYNGNIKVQVNVSSGKISNVSVISHNETKGFYETAFSKVPAAIVSSKSTNVDTVSGATHSSNGIINAVKNALANA